MADNVTCAEAPRRFERSLSVFFPCYNEAGNIERVARRAVEVLDELVEDWEIILVNDGSDDETGEIIDSLAAGEPRIRAVHHRVNGGYGMALRSGFAAARKEYVFYTDGDGQFDIAEIARLLDRADAADLVSGYRLDRQDSFVRRLNAAAWTWLVQLVLGVRCRDVDCAFKLYRREMFDRMELKSTGALIDAEIIARAVRMGYTLETLPVSHYPRLAGEQSGANLWVILRAFRELLRLRRDIVARGN